MALDIHFVVIQIIISQVLSSYAQYAQYAGTPYSIPAYVTSYPVQGFAPSAAPVYTQPYLQPAPTVPFKAPVGPSASYAKTGPTYAPVPSVPSPPVFQPTAYQTASIQQPIKATAVTPSDPDPPKLMPAIPQIPKEPVKKTNPLPKETSEPSSFDSNVLNNLAIALQLLIVSNLIHNPPPDRISEVRDEDLLQEIAPLPIAYIPPSIPESTYPNHIPNANFLGTSSFGDIGLSKSMMGAYGSPTIPVPRPSTLMSPYDAIGPNSPYLDPFKSKPEPKSPYHLSSDYKDLFSLTELFKI